MRSFLGEKGQGIRFTLLVCGLLTLAGAVACLVLGNAILAIACCVVSAWSIGLYVETLLAGFIRDDRFSESDTE